MSRRVDVWVTDTTAMKVALTGHDAARCFYHGHDLHDDGPDRRVCDRCGVALVRAALEGR